MYTSDAQHELFAIKVEILFNQLTTMSSFQVTLNWKSDVRRPADPAQARRYSSMLYDENHTNAVRQTSLYLPQNSEFK